MVTRDLFTNILEKPIAVAFLKSKVTSNYTDLIFQTLLFLLFSFDNCLHMWSILLVPEKKTVVKQPVDNILAGMLINRHS